MEGWIKLHRKLLDNPIIMKDSDYLSVWIYLLLNATHQEYDTLFKGKRITLQKGQLITGRKAVCNKLKIGESKVQNILKFFENEHQIKQQTSNQNRLITILKWEEYQKIEQQNEQQPNNDQTTDEQQLNTNKNIKNNKNVKNNNNNMSDSCVDGSRNVGDSCVDGLQEANDSCVDGLQEIINFYENNIGFLPPYGLEVFKIYLEKMPKDLIIYAIQISVEANKRNIKYIKGILNNWENAGIRTLTDAKNENKKKSKVPEKEKSFHQRQYDDLNQFYMNVKKGEQQ